MTVVFETIHDTHMHVPHVSRRKLVQQALSACYHLCRQNEISEPLVKLIETSHCLASERRTFMSDSFESPTPQARMPGNTGKYNNAAIMISSCKP